MANFKKKFSKVPLLDSPALFFLSPGGENSPQKKTLGKRSSRFTNASSVQARKYKSKKAKSLASIFTSVFVFFAHWQQTHSPIWTFLAENT
jgi:hypothetical protein